MAQQEKSCHLIAHLRHLESILFLFVLQTSDMLRHKNIRRPSQSLFFHIFHKNLYLPYKNTTVFYADSQEQPHEQHLFFPFSTCHIFPHMFVLYCDQMQLNKVYKGQSQKYHQLNALQAPHFYHPTIQF